MHQAHVALTGASRLKIKTYGMVAKAVRNLQRLRSTAVDESNVTRGGIVRPANEPEHEAVEWLEALEKPPACCTDVDLGYMAI